MRWPAGSQARSSRASSGGASSCSRRGSAASTATSPSATTPSIPRSRSSASSSRSSRRGRHSCSGSRVRARSRRRGRRSARRIPRTRPRARSAATSPWRCRTTSYTAPTRPSPPSASSGAGLAEKDYVALNRAGWTRSNAEYTDRAAHDTWAQEEITWGQWSKPEREVQILPDVTGKNVVELGCGTAYFGAWLKRAGARRVVGVDVTPAQLETARRMDGEFGLGLELIEANAEDVPLPDESFDLAFSEYGASIWCDPALWIPEAARLLRPGGELVFMRGTTLRILCSPDTGEITKRLERPQKGIYRLDWDDDDWEGVEFHPSTS